MSMDTSIVFNGIDATTGEYLVPPMQLDEIASIARGEKPKKDILTWLATVWHKIRTPYMGLPLGVEPSDVAQAGWAIVFLKDEDPAVKAALQPLIDHRTAQIHNEKIVKVLEFHPDEQWEQWLGRHFVAPGTVEPTKIPFYLLLVGDPRKIPFEFGHLLDVEYCVGRLHFDTPAEYHTYATSVIEYETSNAIPNQREAVFFAPRHAFDPATKMSADHLVNPLADGLFASEDLDKKTGVAQRWGYNTRKIWGEKATKAAFNEIIRSKNGSAPPAFLFTASHGMGFPRGHVSQKLGQGALLCQDWPGFGSINPDHYFSAADIPAESHVQGMVIFHFACYAGGTPERDLFFHTPGQPPPKIAEQPFLAALPKAWLTHPAGGALAVIGHVERAWGYSIITPDAGAQIQTFENAIGRILVGQPLGYALKDFHERYAVLSTGLSALIQKAGWGENIDQATLAARWIERNDAEGYILIGDPAVALRIDDLMMG